MSVVFEWAKQGVVVTYDRVYKILGEGNFVLAMSECHFKGVSTAFYDLWRIENGKITEHWDTIETIPAREEGKNNEAFLFFFCQQFPSCQLVAHPVGMIQFLAAFAGYLWLFPSVHFSSMMK